MVRLAVHGFGVCAVGLALAFGLGVSDSLGVVVSFTTGNTTAPANDFGFDHVAKRGGATGIYVGWGWVLTATHVGAGSVELNGRSYSAATGTAVQLHNPVDSGLGDLTDLTDLTLFRLAESPRLSTLSLYNRTPSGTSGDSVILVGNGYDCEPNMTAWDIDQDDNWTETTLPGDKRGFKAATPSTHTIRWGTNLIAPSSGSSVISLSGVNIISVRTKFHEAPATEYEAQAVSGDSGGGLFIQKFGKWHLAGILHAVDQFPNQPAAAVFDTHTYASDLSYYRDEILSIITPAPGDANFDRLVNQADAAILAANWLKTSGAIWEDGDFNGDGRVNDLDASILAAHWQMGTGGGGGAALASVPEPTVWVALAGLAGTLALWRLRRAA